MRMIVPSGELTWEEKLEIRKHALSCAAKFCAEKQLSAASVVVMAREFEKYLKE